MTAEASKVGLAGDDLPQPRRVRRLAWGAWAIRVGSVAVVLLAWQLYSPHVKRIFLRPPTDVLDAFVAMTQDGTLLAALSVSLRTLAIGLGSAIVIGLLVGIVSARSSTVRSATDPWVVALYSTPTVALVPFLTLWLGIGLTAKIVAIALFAVFPVLINTQQGVRHVDPGLIEVARSFSTSERRLWTDVLLPGALPFIFAGIRLAVPRALVGMIVAEFLISFGGGLGSLIIVYQNTFRVDKMFVPVIVVSIMGVILIGIVQWLEGLVAPWARRSS